MAVYTGVTTFGKFEKFNDYLVKSIILEISVGIIVTIHQYLEYLHLTLLAHQPTFFSM